MDPHLLAFFDRLKTEADLDALVQERQEEGLTLEFKQKMDTRTGDVDEGTDRRAFSESLSAFANSAGGVLIFGIQTKKSPDHPDRAHALKPITNAERFRTRLQDLVLTTTQPVIDGVRVEIIPGSNGAGYVKCLIPASDQPPHRALHDDRQYLRRLSVGQTRKMEHYELEEVFGRRQRPVLRLHAQLTQRVDPDPHEEVHFFLKNQGRGVARHMPGFWP